MSVMSDSEEDLMASQLKTKKKRPNLWLKHIAQSRQIYIRQEVESQRRFDVLV